MDYSDMFLETDEPRKLSRKEALRLQASLGRKLLEEAFDSNYKSKIIEPYCSEEKLLTWLDMLSQTPAYRFFKRYFRPKLHGIENIPDDGALLVANHSTLYLADVAPIYIDIYEKKRRIVYGLGHNLLNESDFIKSVGGTWGKREIGIEILLQDKLAMACPEGAVGAAAPFLYRYAIRPVEGFDFNHMGYLKIAYSANKPIIPIGTVGAEETVIILKDIKPEVIKVLDFLDSDGKVSNNWLLRKAYELLDDFDHSVKAMRLEHKLRSLDSKLRLSNYALGKKMFKWTAASKVIPWVITPPLPARVDSYVGSPIDVREFVRHENDRLGFIKANFAVMNSLQELIDEGLEKRSRFKARFYKELRRFHSI